MLKQHNEAWTQRLFSRVSMLRQQNEAPKRGSAPVQEDDSLPALL